MTADTPSDAAPSLTALLVARARGASDTRLVLDAALGLVAIAALAVWRPPVWPLGIAAAACFTSFGLWGIADRTLGELPAEAPRARAIRVLRAGAAVLGAAAGVALGLGLLGLALGTWIS